MYQKIKRHFESHALGISLLLVSMACGIFFFDYYTPAKWITIYFLTALISGYYFFRKIIWIPKLDKSLFALLSLAFIGVALNFLGHFSFRYEQPLLDFTAFLLLAFVGFQISCGDKRLLRILFWYGITGFVAYGSYALLQSMGLEPLSSLKHNEYPVSFAGYQNMTAEVVGIFLLLIGGLFFNVPRNKRYFIFPLFIFGGIFLFALNCRAVFLALIVSSLFYFKFIRKRAFKVILVFIIVTFAGLAFYKNRSTNSYYSKNINNSLRLTRWANTLALIKAHPLGVGPGNYDFSYLPFYKIIFRDGLYNNFDTEYTEKQVVHSPHNTLLAALAEWGIPVAILFFMFFGLIFFRLLCIKQIDMNERILLLSLFTFIFIDGLFAFPFQTPFPFIVVAVFLGIIFSKIFTTEQKEINLKGSFLLSLLVAVVIYFGSLFTFSKYTESYEPENYTFLKVSCDKFSSVWQNCIKKARYEITANRNEDAKGTLIAMLNKSPYNFIAVKYLASIYRVEGNQQEACHLMSEYDHWFLDNSSIHEAYTKYCKL